MNTLDQYPTPETDCFSGSGEGFNALHANCRDLERRLAACREALMKIANDFPTYSVSEKIAKDALTLTAPKPWPRKS